MTATAGLFEQVQASAEAIRRCQAGTVEIGIILGTGLGGLGREIAVETRVPYGDIPGFPLSTVESMELLLEKLEKTKSNAEFLNSMSSM